MPRINTSVDDFVLQSDHAFEFPTEPVSLIVDPMFVSDDSEMCAESLSDTRLRGKNEERRRFETIKIKPNEMFKNLNSTFVKINDDVLESVSSPLKHVNRAHSMITKEAGSRLNPNCEPYVPTASLEQASTSTSSSQGDCDVKPFVPKDFHDKVCSYACGRPATLPDTIFTDLLNYSMGRIRRSGARLNLPVDQ
ncbi:hypothetical protein R6Q57_008621 [Mikania cordata]